ncbi:MAG: hypothetical protein SFU83_05120 [Meiothermus sp.]|nr:hypothetical protein [Meiothermus sp.]
MADDIEIDLSGLDEPQPTFGLLQGIALSLLALSMLLWLFDTPSLRPQTPQGYVYSQVLAVEEDYRRASARSTLDSSAPFNASDAGLMGAVAGWGNRVYQGWTARLLEGQLGVLLVAGEYRLVVLWLLPFGAVLMAFALALHRIFDLSMLKLQGAVWARATSAVIAGEVAFLAAYGASRYYLDFETAWLSTQHRLGLTDLATPVSFHHFGLVEIATTAHAAITTLSTGFLAILAPIWVIFTSCGFCGDLTGTDRLSIALMSLAVVQGLQSFSHAGDLRGLWTIVLYGLVAPTVSWAYFQARGGHPAVEKLLFEGWRISVVIVLGAALLGFLVYCFALMAIVGLFTGPGR